MSNTPVIHQLWSSDSPAINRADCFPEALGFASSSNGSTSSTQLLTSLPHTKATATARAVTRSKKSRLVVLDQGSWINEQHKKLGGPMDLPLFLFKCENGKDRKEGTRGVWYLFAALIGFISLPAQDTGPPRGSTRNRTELHLMSFLVAYSLSLQKG